MKKHQQTFGSIAKLTVLISFTFFSQVLLAQDKLPAVGTSAILGKIQGVAVEAKVQSPSNQLTPLQVICVFEYTEGDIFISPPALPAPLNGMVHVDQQLKGLVTELRKSGKFAGHALETILLTPPKGMIPAEHLLIIGLGDRNKFTPDIMINVGRIGMREAIRLGVTSYSHASDLKDGGLDSPTELIAGNVIRGAFDAYTTELFLQSKHMTTFKPLTKITLLAGPAFYTISGKAISATIETLNK